MADKSSTASGGIGFTGLLTISFIVLKLTKVIDWSWWWVLSPVWISAGLSVLVLLGIGAVLLTVWLLDRKDRKRGRHG